MVVIIELKRAYLIAKCWQYAHYPHEHCQTRFQGWLAYVHVILFCTYISLINALGFCDRTIYDQEI